MKHPPLIKNVKKNWKCKKKNAMYCGLARWASALDACILYRSASRLMASVLGSLSLMGGSQDRVTGCWLHLAKGVTDIWEVKQ